VGGERGDEEEDQDGGKSAHDGWLLSFYGERIIHPKIGFFRRGTRRVQYRRGLGGAERVVVPAWTGWGLDGNESAASGVRKKAERFPRYRLTSRHGLTPRRGLFHCRKRPTAAQTRMEQAGTSGYAVIAKVAVRSSITFPVR
jgi:hypothetical protein